MKMFFTQAYASLVKAVIGEPRITTMLAHSFKSSNLFAYIYSIMYIMFNDENVFHAGVCKSGQSSDRRTSYHDYVSA